MSTGPSVVTDYYRVLGLQQFANAEEVKAAFRRKALDLHPDHGGTDEEMAQANQAYEYLMDPEKKKIIDEDLKLSDEVRDADVSLDGFLNFEGQPFSDEFKSAHARLVEKFKLEIRSGAGLKRKKITNQDPQDAISSDLFSFVRNRGSQSHEKSQLDLNFFRGNLTSEKVIQIFLHFLSGNCKHSDLKAITAYLSSWIKRSRAFYPKGYDALYFYEAVFKIFEMVDEPSKREGLLVSLHQLTKFSFKRENIVWMVPLMQNENFRTLVKTAVHRHWETPVDWLADGLFNDFTDRSGISNAIISIKKEMLGLKNEQRFDELKSLLPELRTLDLFEKFLEGHQDSKEESDWREKAWDLINWQPIFDDRQLGIFPLINLYIQAGMCLQKSAALSNSPALKMAHESIAIQMYQIALILSDRQGPFPILYTGIHVLRYLSCLEFEHPRLDKVLEFQKTKLLEKVNFFSLVALQAPNLELIYEETDRLYSMRQLLQTLVGLVEHNQSCDEKEAVQIDHTDVVIFKTAYEACLNNWYRREHFPEEEKKLRLALINAILEENGWDLFDLNDNMSPDFSPLPRDENGWLIPPVRKPNWIESMEERFHNFWKETYESAKYAVESVPYVIYSIGYSPSPDSDLRGLYPKNYKAGEFIGLPYASPGQSYRSLDGFDLKDNGEVMFYFTPETDEKIVPALTQADLKDMIKHMDGNGAAFLSLDPVGPGEDKNPFNQIRFEPPHFYKTHFLNAMLEADYLLKAFTTGQEIQAQYPYDARDISHTISKLPIRLRVIISHFQQNSKPGSVHRFWIEFLNSNWREEPDAKDHYSGVPLKDGIRYAVGPMEVRVKKHLMQLDEKGDYTDAPEEAEGWPIYVFREDYDNRYEKEADSFPEKAIFIVRDHYVVFRVNGTFLKNGSLDFEWSLFVLRQNKDGKGRLIPTAENQYDLYCLTHLLCERIEQPHGFSAESIFAMQFSNNYDKFGEYFPCFEKLKQMAKFFSVLNFINKKLEAKKEERKVFKDLLDACEKDWTVLFTHPNYAPYRGNPNFYFAKCKEHLLKTIEGLDLFIQNMSKTGWGSCVANDLDLSEACLLMPASIKHSVTDRVSRLVYGGVLVAPSVTQVQPGSKQGRAIPSPYTSPRCEVSLYHLTVMSAGPRSSRGGNFQGPPAAPPPGGGAGGGNGSYGSGGDGGNRRGGRRSPSPASRPESASNAWRLKARLAFEEAGILAFGRLTDAAIQASKPAMGKKGKLTNPSVIRHLKLKGGDIKDWKKMKTESITLRGTNQSVQIHFYKNEKIGKVAYGHPDFKVKGVVHVCPEQERSARSTVAEEYRAYQRYKG